MEMLPALRSGDNPSTSSKFLKTTTSTEKIKFVLDFTNIEEGTSEEEISFVKDLLVPTAIDRISNFLSVTGSHIVGPLRSGACKDEDIPKVDEKYYKESHEGDMIIFVGIRTLNIGILAYSATCSLDPSTSRPVAGQVIFNSRHAHPKTHFFLNSYATLIHEILHGLGFNPSLYTSFTKVSGGYGYFRENGAYIMIGNELVKQVKRHFDCDTIDGVKMENEGDSGSSGAHFERLHFGNETMVSEDINYPVLSSFTLALLKDSGFYSVDMDKAQEFHWGKNKGCAFLTDDICTKSDQYSEICTLDDELDCDDTYYFITKCKSTKFTNNCKINDLTYGCNIHHSFDRFKDREVYPSSISSFGNGSRCVKVKDDNKTRVTCMKVECSSDGTSYTIYFKDDEYYKCEKEGHQIIYGDYTTTCLNPLEFCQIKHNCPNNCNYNGECLNDGSCYCYPFFSGDQCENYIGCPTEISSICGDILDKNLFDSEGIFFILVQFAFLFLFHLIDE